MSRFVSNEGIWHPQKERVGLKNRSSKVIKNPSSKESKFHGEKIEPGEDYIYEGPDRAALLDMWTEGKSNTLGTHFEKNPEVIQAARNLGYDNVQDYAKAMGYDAVSAKKSFDDNVAKVSKHDLPKKVAAIERLGGGTDMSGSGKDKFGGFGDTPENIG